MEKLTDIMADIAKEYDAFEEEYIKYTRRCTCALNNLTSRIENLQTEMQNTEGYNIIASFSSRIKTIESTCKKLKKQGEPRTMESVYKMHDIAGIRIVTPYQDDIYKVKDALARQQSLEIIKVKDYVKDPKENGYQSLHLIGLMSYHAFSKKYTITVEIQIRSKSMDYWASTEHDIRYKNPALSSDKAEEIEAKIVSKFKKYAEILKKIDSEMMELRDEANVRAATEFLEKEKTS